MWISRIEPLEPIHKLAYAISLNLDTIWIEGHVKVAGSSIKLYDLKLKVAQYHTMPYQLSPNWMIKEGSKPVAVNIYHPSIKAEVRKTRHLNEIDWIKVNELLNVICDKMGIKCTIRSSLITIRKGEANVWLENYREFLDKRQVSNSLVYEYDDFSELTKEIINNLRT